MEFLFLASVAQIMQYAGYVLIAVLVLLANITVHEFGHYITGKMLGFGIEEFAIGFGPKLFSRTKKNGEVFSIRLLPLGGFCAFLGEDKDESDPKAFNNRKPWQRLIVLVAGATMNYLFALLMICIMFGGYGTTALMAYEVSEENPSGITLTEENSFLSRDKIVAVEGKNVFIVTDLISAVNGKRTGEEVRFHERRRYSGALPFARNKIRNGRTRRADRARNSDDFGAARLFHDDRVRVSVFDAACGDGVHGIASTAYG